MRRGGVVGEEGETWVVGVLILFVFLSSVIVNGGVECTVGERLSECEWRWILQVDVYSGVLGGGDHNGEREGW